MAQGLPRRATRSGFANAGTDGGAKASRTTAEAFARTIPRGCPGKKPPGSSNALRAKSTADLAAYSIVTEGNAAQYYPDYTYNHPVFTAGMARYADTKVSDFFRSIDDERALPRRMEPPAREHGAHLHLVRLD